ncbi:trypsin-like peptidase domain-containing protein [Streptomyces sp. UNOC14_S4]|uniref:trypsin-like peptidase domain-containing protein n=1 Tax=Streptomyces sp. UNOC14_S4 TaxID=2872340 RepID=UPI001E4ACF58|nr:trypsin-like peptidase domain-containing protein [Streptomyces sp. UNOC14_S4]MCC3768242.1 trypsin-like peptidase domain-containing protein [Streptomyces sp. UNOC14_S4]
MRDAVLARKHGSSRIHAALAACATGVVTAGLLWGGSGPAQAAEHPAPLIGAGSVAGKKFRSTGRLIGGGGTTCTATVVADTAKPDPARKALILSNGHCVDDMLGTNDVVLDEAAPEGFTFTPAYFHDDTAEQRTFTVERVSYATMKDIDVSVLRLSATYGELAKLNVLPRTLAAEPPGQGTALQAAHAPTDGVESGEQFLRLSECKVTGTSVALHESTWLWRGFTRTDCLGISGGSSGGVVTAANGDRVVGLLNTVTTPGYLGCGLGRPCEGSASGLVVPKDDTVYATPVGAVASCLDATGLKPDKAGCRLDLGEQVAVTASGKQTRSATADGPARWDAHIAQGKKQQHTYVAVKSGPFGAVDCTRPEGYGKPRQLTAAGLDHAEPLPKKDNLYVLCAAGGPSADLRGAAWEKSLAHPSYAYARVDNTPPTVPATIDVQNFGEGADATFWVRPVYQPWEISAYKVKYGPKATTNCADPEGYRYFLGIPASLKASEGPWTYCAIGYDNADNPTAPVSRVIG